jgi:hypothetical protein
MAYGDFVYYFGCHKTKFLMHVNEAKTVRGGGSPLICFVFDYLISRTNRFFCSDFV